MFDEPALKLLMQTAIGDYNGKQERLSGTGTIALPDNLKLHDLEKYQPQRRRFRGAFHTSSISDFIAYVKQRKGEGYIDADKHSATVFFNLGTVDEPGHADHTAVLTLKPTAAYSAMVKIDGAKATQRDVLDWLEDWADNLRAITNTHEGGTEVPWARAIQAIREVTIKKTSEVETSQGDFRAARSAMEEEEAKSRHELPSGFLFRCEPYLGLPEREFFLRLGVLTSSDKPVLVLRIVRKEAHDEGIAKDFKELLIREVADDAALTIGTFAP